MRPGFPAFFCGAPGDAASGMDDRQPFLLRDPSEEVDMELARVFFKRLPPLRGTSTAVLCAFLFSGVAGLTYQILWVRMIDKLIGSAPFAVATVLTVFMGGLALGSSNAGRIADRSTSRGALLSLYGMLEIAVGAYALLLPFLIEAATPLYSSVYDALLSHFWVFRILAFFGCSLLLIPPTTLMGLTLPIICRFYVTSLDHLGARTGMLYGMNTIGAALGAVLCGFVLIDRLGLWGALCAAASINFMVGAACIFLGRREARSASQASDAGRTRREKGVKARKKNTGAARLPHAPPDSTYAAQTHGGGENKPIACAPDGELRWALLIAAVSGFCSMACEVLWTRLLGLIMGPTTYSFTLVVATFIVGLAAGSIIFGRLGDRSPRALSLLAWTQICAAALALAVSQFLGNGQFFFSKLIHALQGSFQTMILAQSLLLFAILIWPTLFFGAAFPLVNRIYSKSIPALGSTIGTAYALNTVGAILGSFAAGFIIVPLVGKENGLKLVIGLQLATALAALTRSMFRLRERLMPLSAGACAAAIAIALLVYFPSWDRNILSRGWYRNYRDIANELERTTWVEALTRGPSLLVRERGGLEVAFYGDGIGGFTTVEKETTSIGVVEYALFNSGKPDASSHGDRSTQTLSGHIPLLFHPCPEKIVVIGLASGMTLGEALLHPIKRADVLEINEQVAKACKLFFTPWNNDCLNDPRTRLIVQDGRNHLALTREEYDAIISEPSNPWMAGLANLYTRDFFRLARARLKDKGIFAQWIQSYEMDWSTFAMVGRTFADVFPDGALMKTGPGDYLLLGFVDRKGIDWQTAAQNMEYARKSINASFEDHSILAHLVITEDLPAFFGDGPLHTDDRPHLEYSAPKQLNGENLDLGRIVGDRRRLSPETQKIVQANSNAEGFLDLIRFSASANVPLFSILNPDHLADTQKELYRSAVKQYCSRVVVPSYHIFPDRGSKKECAETQIAGILHRLAEDDGRADDHFNLGLSMMAAGREHDAQPALERTISLDPHHQNGLTALGLLQAKKGDMKEAVRHLSRVVEIAPGSCDAHKNFGMALVRLGQLDQALAEFAKALSIDPRNVAALNEMGIALLAMGKIDDAMKRFAAASEIDPRDVESHRNMAAAYFRKGDLENAAKRFEQALRLSSGDADIRYNLEMVSKLLERSRKASAD